MPLPMSAQSMGTGFLPADETEFCLEVLLARILATARVAWHCVLSSATVSAGDEENRVSDLLTEEMNRLNAAIEGPYHFRIEWQLPRRSRPGMPKRDTQPDAIVFYCWKQVRDIIVECKKISNSTAHKRDKLGRDYVDKGVRRFTSGQYARGEVYGLMWGFVLDSDVSGTADRLASYVAKRATPPACRAWQAEPRFGACADLFSTEHIQTGGPHRIELLHLLLPF